MKPALHTAASFLITTTALLAADPAPHPLYRDPVHDGAADPVLCYDRGQERWLMFYTNRRANVPNLPGVSWVHGTRIHVAESRDAGATWKHLGPADIRYGDQSHDTYWAPDVFHHDGVFHMFVTFVPGRPKDWNEIRRIVHLASKDLLTWTDPREVKLASDRVIDASVCQFPDDTWGLWYNNERDRKSIYLATSRDLSTWTDQGKVALGDRRGEGPKVFRWRNRYFMLVDHWAGLGAYSSPDARTWTRQDAMLLDTPGTGTDDGVIGQHCDVIVTADNRAFLFYFTHPGRRGPDAKKDTTEQRRSSLHVTELHFAEDNKSLTCDRNAPTHLHLSPP